VEGGPDLQKKLSAGLEVGVGMNLLKIAGLEVGMRVSQNENRQNYIYRVWLTQHTSMIEKHTF
jgi:hypothetical protein